MRPFAIFKSEGTYNESKICCPFDHFALCFEDSL
jgi:hypothetical protein